MVRDTKPPASGKFVLRIDPGLHAALRRAARAEGISLNDFCARKLAAPAGSTSAPEGATAAVQLAIRLFGADLIAVAVFGSWARGEAADGSDVDLLIVLDDRRKLTRALYRAWDDEPLRFAGRSAEPQFVHLPPDDLVVAGLWAEVALDGIVLFEQALLLSRRLVRVRRDIVSGRIVRRVVHGQSYWVSEVA